MFVYINWFWTYSAKKATSESKLRLIVIEEIRHTPSDSICLNEITESGELNVASLMKGAIIWMTTLKWLSLDVEETVGEDCRGHVNRSRDNFTSGNERLRLVSREERNRVYWTLVEASSAKNLRVFEIWIILRMMIPDKVYFLNDINHLVWLLMVGPVVNLAPLSRSCIQASSLNETFVSE